MEAGIFILAIGLMVLFIPNNGERDSPFTKLMSFLGSNSRLKIAKENEGNKEFILNLVNEHITNYNRRSALIGDISELKPNVTDIDPYSRYIFHGACLSCPIPLLESISGCSACRYGNDGLGIDRSEVSEELRQAGIEAQNKRLDEVAKAHKGDIPFILEMVNKSIEDLNEHLSIKEETKTEIDPFSIFIFHGGCHGCDNPLEESISGCYSCTYYNCWEGYDKSQKGYKTASEWH